MGSPLERPNGNTLPRVTVVKHTVHAGHATRRARWIVDVGIPKLIPDHLTALPRDRAPSADNRLERTARRLIRRQVSRGSTNADEHTR